MERVTSDDERALEPAVQFHRILVPMKLGRDRRGDARDGDPACVRARRRGAGAARDPRAARAAARRVDARRGRASRGRRSRRRSCSVPSTASSSKGRRSVRGRSARRSSSARWSRRRPDRARLGAALASPVALLLAHGRLRPAEGAVRGADRRLPPVGSGRGVGRDLSGPGPASTFPRCEGDRDRLRPGRLGRRAPARTARAGT